MRRVVNRWDTEKLPAQHARNPATSRNEEKFRLSCDSEHIARRGKVERSRITALPIFAARCEHFATIRGAASDTVFSMARPRFTELFFAGRCGMAIGAPPLPWKSP
jgi:hypothetical protein